MNYLKFKDAMAVKDQIRLLMRAARIFGAPIIKRKVSETEGIYCVTYGRKGEKHALVLRLTGDDNELMINCLALATRNQS